MIVFDYLCFMQVKRSALDNVKQSEHFLKKEVIFMSHFRWTIKDLEEMTNRKLIENLIAERKEDCTNVYAPLYKRLQKLETWVSKNIKD